MQLQILGEVQVVGDDGAVLRIAAARPRALLGLLILNANRVVGPSILTDGLWGDRPPKNPIGALQVVVSRLRVALGSYGDRVVSESGGYRLDVGPDETDLFLAEALLRDGRAALGREEAARAAADFERALSLWGGRPLEDLSDLPFVAEAGRRLHELRISLVEARNDAYLAGGRHLDLLVDIERLVAAEPLREHLREQQVVALYRAGRQAEALRACDALRRLLREELGVEISPAMAVLERRVLDHDPSLLAADTGFMTPLPAWTVEGLPFVGREREYQQVLSCLREAIVDGVRVVLVEGDAGLGKSRFLLQCARLMAGDAIVLPVHSHDVFNPTLNAFARVLAEATRRISDQELREIVEGFPQVPNDVGQVREAAAALASGQPRRPLRDEELLENVAPWIAALSAKAPVVVVVDDLDTAGTALLHVLWHLTTLLIPRRVLVLGSARGSLDQTPSAPLARTCTALDRRGLLQRIMLAPLDADDIEALLDRMRVTPSGELVNGLRQLTAGSPFLLAETLNIASPEQAIEQWTSPPRIRDLVRQRTAELGRAAAELCEQACLFDDDFSISILAEVAGVSEAVVTTLVDRMVAAHVLQSASLRTLRFAHQLFRHALVADLSDAQRADGHRRIAGAFEHAGAPAALLAAHWASASGPDVPARTIRHARAAGREALELFEPRAAITWFELALEHLENDDARGALLVELATAEQLAGDPHGNETLASAVDLAISTDDDELTLQIIRAVTPGWLAPPGVTRADGGKFVIRALGIAKDDATRSRLLARRAVELSLADTADAERMADEATTLARQSGDRVALAEVLLLSSSVSLSPHSLDGRERMLQELVELNNQSTDIPTRYFTLSGLVVAAMQAGDLSAVERHAAEADTIAGQYDLATIRWSAMLRHAWRAGLAGHLEHAEQLIEDARTFGRESAVPGAAETALIQLGLLRWQQDRVAEILPAARAAFDTYQTVLPGIGLILARALAADDTGHSEARALLMAFADDKFERVGRGMFWSTALTLTAETACILDLPDLSRPIRDLLLPFADQVAFTGTWVTAPIAYGIGIAMTGCNDPRAPQMLEHAARISARIQAPTLAALARRQPFARRL